ncbi:hypothetical protein LVB77_01300 [Lysobacter sp. 5GHs7-4]|uniref:hypothetical protein n=1 Tax=Lysobacter sp. 5GHs7-4 TaxID=2904253 RepID=UPI001E4BE04A|nr:hypothetical protein [Lysobacter sp. 5GHs7-4]UHQ23380.1 hypothetical protein LVB77_01300 [Lysobacter sp. 5GHs7-4]
MRLIPCLAVLSLSLAGCAATDPGKTAATAEPAPAETSPAVAPRGKIGADQVGQVSPVPAFKGLGEHWSVDIQARGGMDHSVALVWGSGSYRADGHALYRGQPADAPSSLIVLSGELQTPQGAKPMTIEILRKDCTDDGDRPHQHSVSVHVEGMDALRGCGDLAVY